MEDSTSKIIWRLKIPPRARVFSWRLFKNRLPTRDNLRRRHFFDHEIDTMAAFMADIEGIQIQPLSRDFLTWGADPAGYYTTKSAYNLLKAEDSSNLEDSIYKTIWRLHIPPRATVFSWRILKNRLPTRDNLRRMHVELPSL